MISSHLHNASVAAARHPSFPEWPAGPDARPSAADESSAGDGWRVAIREASRWDPLLMCVAGYLLMSVGRVHQLFSLEAFRPASLTGGLALLLFWLDRHHQRRLQHVCLPTTTYLMALFAWIVISTPGSLSEGTSFTLVFDNFL